VAGLGSHWAGEGRCFLDGLSTVHGKAGFCVSASLRLCVNPGPSARNRANASNRELSGFFERTKPNDPERSRTFVHFRPPSRSSSPQRSAILNYPSSRFLSSRLRAPQFDIRTNRTKPPAAWHPRVLSVQRSVLNFESLAFCHPRFSILALGFGCWTLGAWSFSCPSPHLAKRSKAYFCVLSVKSIRRNTTYSVFSALSAGSKTTSTAN